MDLAHAHGLGGVFIACYPNAERMAPVKRHLQLPAEVLPFCVIPLGYPAEEGEVKDKWNPANVHYERW